MKKGKFYAVWRVNKTVRLVEVEAKTYHEALEKSMRLCEVDIKEYVAEKGSKNIDIEKDFKEMKHAFFVYASLKEAENMKVILETPKKVEDVLKSMGVNMNDDDGDSFGPHRYEDYLKEEHLLERNPFE